MPSSLVGLLLEEVLFFYIEKYHKDYSRFSVQTKSLIYTEDIVNVDRFIRRFLPDIRPSFLQVWARQPANRVLASFEWSKTNAQTFIPSLAESRNHSSRHGYILSVVLQFHLARKLPWGSAHSVCDLIG